LADLKVVHMQTVKISTPPLYIPTYAAILSSAIVLSLCLSLFLSLFIPISASYPLNSNSAEFHTINYLELVNGVERWCVWSAMHTYIYFVHIQLGQGFVKSLMTCCCCNTFTIIVFIRLYWKNVIRPKK